MHHELVKKLEMLSERARELELYLSEKETALDAEKFRLYSMEYAQLAPIVDTFQAWLKNQAEAKKLDMLEQDPEYVALVEEERLKLNSERDALEEQLQAGLLPADPRDQKAVFLEIRAGTGGIEAGLFAAVLLRMYLRYAERKGWRAEILSQSESEQGGIREVIVSISGKMVYGHLKFESGGHRVQRIPITETQGRIHTSACTVAVLPETEQMAVVAIQTSDLRIDTFRSSGAGGQHVNTTDSAIRITHLPTGIVVECQDERSQHKNRARALRILAARIEAAAEAERLAAEAVERKTLVGSGGRSDRIRTYNFPQSRVTDHRINLTLYRLDSILDGELDWLLEPLRKAERLAELTQMKQSLA